ncbi:CGNR zinc finger domain-containing protein [Paenibacillus sp. NAIST15-1]|uniref:CGNR zinc finger domain-containing protein n=1 Tax=Paenibacillus sp. NAIST15-1 TaxID=1605994 RepID=UPI00086B4305|nr:CGNR zinc finger domain-containing protein [Paenibacillus sp. NAIST15-1]GAV11338.1 transposase IS3/IS911 family protein [Paenibacillus sp. NAIST15-1]
MNHKSAITDEVRNRIVNLLRGGHTIVKIEELTGVHRTTIFKIKCKLGLVKNYKSFTCLSKKKVRDIQRDLDNLDRQPNSDDIKRLSKLHDVSEPNILKVIKEGINAVSKVRPLKPQKIQMIYKSLEEGKQSEEIIEKTGVSRTTLVYYRERYNRGKDIRVCASSDCDNTFLPRLDGKPKLYCSTRCRDREKQRRYRSLYSKQNRCPQCGGEWVEPNETYRGKPKHCLNCQEYYHLRYEKNKDV